MYWVIHVVGMDNYLCVGLYRVVHVIGMGNFAVSCTMLRVVHFMGKYNSIDSD